MNKLLCFGLICLLACACERVRLPKTENIEADKPYRSPKLKREIQKRDLLVYQELEYVYTRQHCARSSKCLTLDSLRRLLAGKMQIDAQGFITRLEIQEARDLDIHPDFALFSHLRRLKRLAVSYPTAKDLAKIYQLRGLQRLTLSRLQASDFDLTPLLDMKLDTLEIINGQVKRLMYPARVPFRLKHLHLKGNRLTELPKELLFSQVIPSMWVQERHISPTERAFMQANKASKMRLVLK